MTYSFCFRIYFPKPLRDLLHWYVSNFNDILMGAPPVWFKSIIVCELFFQLPMFFVLAYGIYNRKTWIRIPSIIYGSHVATTLVPILATFITNERIRSDESVYLLAFYLPYFIIPLLLTIHMAITPIPFPKQNVD